MWGGPWVPGVVGSQYGGRWCRAVTAGIEAVGTLDRGSAKRGLFRELLDVCMCTGQARRLGCLTTLAESACGREAL